jgi:hypothetical protein
MLLVEGHSLVDRVLPMAERCRRSVVPEQACGWWKTGAGGGQRLLAEYWVRCCHYSALAELSFPYPFQWTLSPGQQGQAGVLRPWGWSWDESIMWTHVRFGTSPSPSTRRCTPGSFSMRLVGTGSGQFQPGQGGST